MVSWDDVRALALALPEVEEGTSWGRASFTVRGTTFAGLSRHEGAMWARCDRDERPLIVDSNPEVYVRERLIDAWLLKAPKRLAAQHAFD